ncbi:unnamed protein product [Orchesella dallaii]|uniref:DUF243 domain-containing protein n=1 Tax=Orchesella dallaii TaxID=48710 RepID=A0ABP1RDR2_9HEXA
MTIFLLVLLSTMMAFATAQYPDSRPQYGVPTGNIYIPQQQGNFPAPQQRGEIFQSALPKGAPVDLKVFRHVYVHSAPNDEPQSSQIRRIRGPGGDEKHVSVIFVKAPAPAAPDQQVVEVPNDGGRKTLVYVLLKKAADAPDVKFSGPAPTKPSKPEVYFIRYKDQQTTPGSQPESSGGAIPVARSPNSIAGGYAS